MRVCLYGGVANDMYLIAGALAGGGASVRFVRDRGHALPFGQPVWQDCSMSLCGGEALEAGSWDAVRWARTETEVGWKPPAWLADPREGEGPVHAGLGGADGLFLRAVLARRPHLRAVLAWMREADVVLANGLEGTGLALAAGRPFVLWPHGADIRFAARMGPQPGGGLVARVENWFWSRLMRRAYARAARVGTHDPRAAGGWYGDPLEALASGREWFFPLPVPLPEVAHRRGERRAMLGEALQGLGLAAPPEEHLVVLVPSRVDYRWKGHDTFFQALERVGAPGRVTVFVTGWGADRERAAARLADSPLVDDVVFIPCIVSKPILYRLMGGVDVVADQFTLGGHGLATLEALACGAATLTLVDRTAYERKGFPCPPVLGGRTVEAVARPLADILDGRLDLEAVSRRGREWIARYHAPQAVAERVLPVLKEIADADED